jgi:hypothetical protein
MNFSRTLVIGGALLLLSACGDYGRGGPDGGTNRIICVEGIQSLSVNVKDASGAPVKNATVSAKHSGTGSTVTSTSNDQGIATAVTSEQGSGTIQLKATEGSRVSTVQQIDWQCGECTCTATPSAVTLVVE